MKLARFSGSAVVALCAAVTGGAIVLLGAAAFMATSGAAALAVLAAAATALLSSGACMWVLHARVLRPLEQVIADGQRIVKGDLTVPITASATGEARELQALFGEVKETLVGIVRDVRSSAISIDTTAVTLNMDNQALAQRNDTQAASIKETSSSLESLASSTAQNADTAQRVSALVGTSCDNAVKGNEVVKSVAGTMDAIRSSSQKIADIVGVIDGIAFQTNILALNAAVEAARAGEQGRGFAVVASEVRHLAQRSAQEAKDIKLLIDEAVKNVETGSALVGQAGQTMSEIVSSVTSVAGFMKEIATASRDQSEGIQRISAAVLQLEALTEENTTLAATALRASENVKVYAGTLSESVAGFSLGAEFGTAEEAVELVKKAVAFAKEKGLQALVEDVNKLNKGKLVFKDLYLSVYGFDGYIKAHGANRHFIGANTSATRDKNGKPFIADMIALGKSAGSGWVHYLFAHPVTQEVREKAAYLERVDDCVVTCGCYVGS